FQRGRAAGHKSRECTSLNGMAHSCHPERSEGSVPLGLGMLRCPQRDRVGALVTLSVAKGLSGWASRCFAALSMTGCPCHPERSEGSVPLGLGMLRCPQHDQGLTVKRSSAHLDSNGK